MSAEMVYTRDFTTTCHVCGVPTTYVDSERMDTRCEHVMGQIYEVTPSDSDVDDFLALNDDEFEFIVSSDAKRQATALDAACLRHDDVLDRWREALAVLHARVLSDLAANKGDMDPEVRRWRRTAMHFKASLTQRQQEAKQLITERNIEEAAARAGSRSAEKRAEKERRRTDPVERAKKRLIDAHLAEFQRYLSEEREALGKPSSQ